MWRDRGLISLPCVAALAAISATEQVNQRFANHSVSRRLEGGCVRCAECDTPAGVWRRKTIGCIAAYGSADDFAATVSAPVIATTACIADDLQSQAGNATSAIAATEL